MKANIRVLLCAALLGLALTQAHAFPTKPVKILCPQAPGGASDALSRIIAMKLAEKWGQPVVVENRAGAGGNIGTAEVAKAPADGYTLLLAYIGTHVINPHLYKDLPWHPTRDFAAVATLAAVPFVAVVNPDVPAKTTQELIALARREEGKLTFASAGNGSVNHLLGELFANAAGVKMTHVPYKGAGPALSDTIAGQVRMSFTSLPSAVGHIKGGRLRAIAVTSAQRSESVPDIPTLAESGLPGFDVNPWFGLLVPAGTPEAVVNQLNRDINEALATADVKDKFSKQGAVPLTMTPAQFAEQLKADLAKWEKVVRDSGARID